VQSLSSSPVTTKKKKKKFSKSFWKRIPCPVKYPVLYGTSQQLLLPTVPALPKSRPPPRKAIFRSITSKYRVLKNILWSEFHTKESAFKQWSFQNRT
jgi:hypothetical protein